jgi:hypothetical protein
MNRLGAEGEAEEDWRPECGDHDEGDDGGEEAVVDDADALANAGVAEPIASVAREHTGRAIRQGPRAA